MSTIAFFLFHLATNIAAWLLLAATIGFGAVIGMNLGDRYNTWSLDRRAMRAAKRERKREAKAEKQRVADAQAEAQKAAQEAATQGEPVPATG